MAETAEIEICHALQAGKDLKKHSIYILDSDTDRDFEFFVFVDAGNEENRPQFLRALRVALGLDPDSKNQIESQCQQDWGERFSNRPYPKPEFNLLNWLKIAIEDYPFRLFVVINPKEWEGKNSDPTKTEFWKDQNQFLYKRICFIHFKDFQNNFPLEKGAEKTEYEKFKNWLYGQWILHLLISMYRLTEHKIRIEIHGFERGMASSFKPLTAAFFYKERLINEQDDAWKSRLLDFKSLQLLPYEKKDETLKTLPLVFISRHRSFYHFEEKKKKWSSGEVGYLIPSFEKKEGNNMVKEHIIPLCISFNLSGAMPGYLHIVQNAAQLSPTNETILFFMAYIEQSLFRTGILDERFQEWCQNMSVDEAGGLYQSRIVPVYGKYNGKIIEEQANLPSHKIFLSVEFLEKLKNEWATGPGEQFEKLWDNSRKKIDFLIVHQGILDKLRKYFQKKSVEQCILDWKDDVPYIVVTSGRGKPEDAPLGAKFLPFSGIETCMVGKRFDKYTLFRQLVSLV